VRVPVRGRRRIGLLLAAPLVGLLLASCSTEDLPRLGFPEPATEEGPSILWLWQSFWVTAFVVGGLTLALILFAALYYRRRSANAPEQTRYNIPIEILRYQNITASTYNQWSLKVLNSIFQLLV
jgi:cytochrome c oxidase subunit 2